MTYFIECKDQVNAAELECLINSAESYGATQDDCLVKLEKLPKMSKLESDYERGMRDAMKDIAKSCGKKFAVDIGYLELPKLVDELVNKNKQKPRTKTVYEKVNPCSDTQLASMFVDGLLYYMDLSTEPVSYCPVTSINELACYTRFHRKVEKEIDWKDQLIEFLKKEKHNGGTVNGWSMGDNEDEFSTVNIDFDFRDKRFIAMCHLVASLTDKPE